MYLKQKEPGGELQEWAPAACRVFPGSAPQRGAGTAVGVGMHRMRRALLQCHLCWWHTGHHGDRATSYLHQGDGDSHHRAPRLHKSTPWAHPGARQPQADPWDVNSQCQTLAASSQSSFNCQKKIWSIQLWLLLWIDNMRNPEHQCPHFHPLTKLLSQVKKTAFLIKSPADCSQKLQDEPIVLPGLLKSTPSQSRGFCDVFFEQSRFTSAGGVSVQRLKNRWIQLTLSNSSVRWAWVISMLYWNK